jgi:hypothetical protein
MNRSDAELAIKKHERAIEILERIRYVNMKIRSRKDSLNGIAGTFPELRHQYNHDIDIFQRTIKRLELRLDILFQ